MASIICSSVGICCFKKINHRNNFTVPFAKIKGKIRLSTRIFFWLPLFLNFFSRYDVYSFSVFGSELLTVIVLIFWRNERNVLFLFWLADNAHWSAPWVICARARQAITGFWLNSCSHTIFILREDSRERERERKDV